MFKAANRNKCWRKRGVGVQNGKKATVPTSHLQNAEEELKQRRKQLKWFLKNLSITNGFLLNYTSKHLRFKNSLC